MRARHVLFAIAIASAAACGGGSKKPDTTNTGTGTTDAKLFDRLGGMDAITAVVDEFVANVAADARINAQFANTDIPKLKKSLVAQICQETGGPCKYEGKSMKEVHVNMKITEADFNATVEDLVKALDKIGVKEKEKTELLTALGAMKADIVTVPQ
jgi:hemoglobin